MRQHRSPADSCCRFSGFEDVPKRHHKLNVRVLAHHMLEAESVDGFHLLRRERIRIRFVQIVIDISSHRTFVVLANHAAHRRTSQHFAHRREGFQRSISWDDDELCLNSTTIKTSYVYLNRLVGFLQKIDVWLRENCLEVFGGLEVCAEITFPMSVEKLFLSYCDNRN